VDSAAAAAAAATAAAAAAAAAAITVTCHIGPAACCHMLFDPTADHTLQRLT